MIDLELLPRRDARLAAHDNTLDVLLRVRAPAAHASQSGCLTQNLAIVIDRSGSMTGTPLAEAKRCAAMIIEALWEKHRASVVAYDKRADVLVASRAMDDKDVFLRAIEAILEGEALHDGCLTGAEQAAHGHQEGVLSQVLAVRRLCQRRDL